MRPVELNDRRAHVRFEVMGLLAGTLIWKEGLRVVDIGVGGALVDSAVPLPLYAEYRMRLVVASHVSDATVKVRRIAEQEYPGRATRYRIGLEFLDICADAREIIAALVSASQSDRNAELGTV